MEKKQAPRIHLSGILQWQSYRVLEEYLDQALDPHKLSAPEWKVLGVIFDACDGDIRPLQIASALGVKAPLVTRILETLENKKLVSSRTLKEDGRVRIISLSPKGREVFQEASCAVAGAMQHLLKGVRPEELKAYKTVLLKILENDKRA